MKTLWLPEVDSTNTYLKGRLETVGERVMVLARRQTAGRGQRGNSWEAEPGRNVTASFWFRPEGVKAAGQFAISEAVALAIVGALADYGIAAKVKWPNDIYVGDRKICGILIENSVMGDGISHSIVGFGLNVNQQLFLSDAPNPVSMAMLTGREYPLQEIAEALGRHFGEYLGKEERGSGDNIGKIGDRERLHEEYIASLWRGDGRVYPFRTAAGRELFHARIAGIEPSGHLLLEEEKEGLPVLPAEEKGALRRFAFKEVEFLF